MSENQKELKPENPFLNIIFNIVIPVFVLNKLSVQLGAAQALLLALAFPISYGLYDLWARKKVNWISVLGLFNVMTTGGFALLGVCGMWFALKEASLPTLLGLWVLGSAYTQNPVVDKMLLNPQIFKRDLVEEKLKSLGKMDDFKNLVKTSTLYFSFSFFLSGLLNFALATYVFAPIDSSLTQEQSAHVLNEQIAQMTSYSFVVIMIPSMVVLGLVLWHLLRGLSKITGLKFEEMMKS